MNLDSREGAKGAKGRGKVVTNRILTMIGELSK
jgi:hypothetical protein